MCALYSWLFNASGQTGKLVLFLKVKWIGKHTLPIYSVKYIFIMRKEAQGLTKHIGLCERCSNKPWTSSGALCEAIAKWLTCRNNFSQNKSKVYSGFSARKCQRLSLKTRDQQSTSSIAQARGLSSMSSLATRKPDEEGIIWYEITLPLSLRAERNP